MKVTFGCTTGLPVSRLIMAISPIGRKKNNANRRALGAISHAIGVTPVRTAFIVPRPCALALRHRARPTPDHRKADRVRRRSRAKPAKAWRARRRGAYG